MGCSPTPFVPSVFLVFRANEETKPREVADLRPVNVAVVPENYPLPCQEAIIAAIRVATHIQALLLRLH